MLDISTRMCPFISHNDVTRMQMSASHIKQCIPLIHAEQPFIRTGFEEQYLDYSSYLYIAKDDGTVIYNDDILMIVKYNTIKGEIIKLDSLYGNREGFDKMLFTKYHEGDKFKKGDILAHHSTINDNGFLNLGYNLKTTYISCPYNYKDSLLISESCAQKMTTRLIHQESIECTDTIPILWNNGEISYPQGTFIEKAKPIFVVKERNPINPVHVISSGEEILSPASGKLYYKIIIDEVVKTKNEENYYESKYKEELIKEELIFQKIKEIYDIETNELFKYEADAYINYYCPQLNKRRSGKSILLTYYIVEEVPLMVGCKLSNRHGNKGVISKIYPDKKMPKDKFGEYADIVVSAMSVTSRMNTGQLFEMHMNRANHLFCINNLHNDNDSIDNKIELIEEFLSNCQPKYITDIFRDWKNNANNDEKELYINDVISKDMIQIVQPPFAKYTYDDLFKFCKKNGKMHTNLKETLIFDNSRIKASFGHTYWYRLEHEPNKKYFARSVGLYGKIGQPSRNNGSNKGAHRVGEMEIWSLLAHQAYENLLEFMVSKSDSISEAARMLKYLFDGCPSRYTPFVQTPGILKVFKTFVNASGYEMKDVDLDENGSLIEESLYAPVKEEPKVHQVEEMVLDVTNEMNAILDGIDPVNVKYIS